MWHRDQYCKTAFEAAFQHLIWDVFLQVFDDTKTQSCAIDTKGNLVSWSRQVNKTLAYCVHFTTITKLSNLHLIDRLKVPWYTASIKQLLKWLLGKKITDIWFEVLHNKCALDKYTLNKFKVLLNNFWSDSWHCKLDTAFDLRSFIISVHWTNKCGVVLVKQLLKWLLALNTFILYKNTW